MSGMNKGDRVYTLDGRAAEYVAEVDGSHAVRPFYDTEDGEAAGDIEFYHRVYAKAPMAIHDADIARARETLADLETRACDARRQLREAERDLSGLKQRLSQHESLQRIDDCLAGRFEWFVVSDYRFPQVLTRDQTLKANDGRWEKWLKLVTLYGDTKGDLQWRISHYQDGSGTSFELWPFFTETDARAKAVSLYEAEVAKWRKDAVREGYKAECWTRNAPEWLAVAEDVLAAVKAKDAAAKAKTIAELEAKLAEARNA